MNNENIKKMIEWVESSSEFIKGQIPDYIEQLLQYRLINTWLNIGVLSIGLIICLILCVFCIWKQSTYEKSYDVPTLMVIGCFIPLALVGPFSIGLISEIHILINIYIAPKVYILNHLRSLIG
jgi:hypothetical protein